MERDRNREPSENKRCRVEQRHSNVVARSKRALPEDAQDMPRAFARKPSKPESQREPDRHGKGRLKNLSHDPPIFIPSSRSETSPRQNSATIPPSYITRMRSDNVRISSSSEDTSNTPAPSSRAR